MEVDFSDYNKHYDNLDIVRKQNEDGSETTILQGSISINIKKPPKTTSSTSQ